MRDSTRQAVPTTRPKRLDIRFGEAELERVQKVAKWRRVPPSTFVRDAATAAVLAAEGRQPVAATSASPATPVATAEQLAQLHEMRVDWKRIGVNLNQLTRASHRGQIDLEGLKEVVEKLAAQVDSVVDLLGGDSRP